MVELIQACQTYDLQCQVKAMMVSERHADPRCSSLLRNYNEVNGKGIFFLSALSLNEVLDQCDSHDEVYMRSILANYYSPSGSIEDVQSSCSKMSGYARNKIASYLKSMGVNTVSCAVEDTVQSVNNEITQSSLSCDFTCEVKSQLAGPNMRTLAGRFANQFLTYKNEPDMLNKLGVFYKKKHGIDVDIISLRNHLEGGTYGSNEIKNGELLQNKNTKQSSTSFVEFNKGTMNKDKFDILVRGAEYAKTSTNNDVEILVQYRDENVIPYAKGDRAGTNILSLGGPALYANKQPGLSQIFSLYGSWAIEIAKELARSPTSIVITSDNGIYKQLKQFTDSHNLLLIENANTTSAKQVLDKISNYAVGFDSKGQPIINANITIIGDHMYIGFLTGSIKVKTSSQNEIYWRSIATNLTSKANPDWLSVNDKLSDFTKSEYRDMPGFKGIIPSGLLPVFRAFVETVGGKEASLPDFAHFLVGYQTYMMMTSNDANSDCSNLLAPEKTGSGDFVLCL